MKIFILTYSDGYDSHGAMSYHKSLEGALNQLNKQRESDLISYEQDLKDFPDLVTLQDKPSEIFNKDGRYYYNSNDYYTYSISEHELED